jgi:hypothetical protein
MWREYRATPTQIACRLVKGEVCAKFSYTFNGAGECDRQGCLSEQLRVESWSQKHHQTESAPCSTLNRGLWFSSSSASIMVFCSRLSPFSVENITYLCTKVNIENETAVNQGCFKQMKSGHEIEVCVCESWAGGTPCNSAYRDRSGHVIFIALTLASCWLSALKSLHDTTHRAL